MASWTAASVVRWALLKNCTFEENSRRNPIVIIPCLVHLGKVRYNSIYTGAAGQVVGHGDDSGGRRQLPLDQVNIISLAQGLRLFFMSHFLKQSKIYVFLAHIAQISQGSWICWLGTHDELGGSCAHFNCGFPDFL